MNESNRPLMLSVVMPVYNEEATVETAVTRLRAALDMPLEIICVDDASTDDSKAILERLREEGMIDQLLRSEEHTSELQSRGHLVCRLLLEKKKILTTY